MDADGNIERHTSPTAVVRWVRKRGAEAGDFVITELEWRNTPTGFQGA
jgi:hypothetical protein